MASFDGDLELPFGGLYDNDDEGMCDAMTSITSDNDTFEFRNTLCDLFSDDYAVPVSVDELMKRGSELLEAERPEEAVKVYMQALESSPGSLIIGIPVMALLVDVGRGEEAVAVSLAGLRASECDPNIEKMARLQMITAYAKLGYGKKALEDVKSISFDLDSMKKQKDEKGKGAHGGKAEKEASEKVSKEEIIKGIEKIVQGSPYQRELDNLDLENTISRLFDPAENKNPGVCAFLFYHLRQHYKKEKLTKKEPFWSRLSRSDIFKNLNAICALKDALVRANFCKWSLLECCMLDEYFDLVHCAPEKEKKATISVLFSQPIFNNFLVKLGETVVQNDSFKFLLHCGTVVHFDLVTLWQHFLLKFAKNQPDFLNTRPFNQLNWHAKVIYASLAGFYGSDYEEVVNIKRMFQSKQRNGYVDACSLFELALKQDWFCEQVAKMNSKSVTESLNLLDMTLHLNFYARNEMLLQPPIEKLVAMSNMRPDVGLSPKQAISLYETLLLRNHSSLLPLCRDRPGLWVHLSQRLEFLAKNMDNFAGHGGVDLQITLNLMLQMLEIDGDIDGYVEDDDFVETVSKSFLLIMSAKVDEPTELLQTLRKMTIRLVVAFSHISDDIPMKLAQPSSVKAGNIFSSFIAMKSFDAMSAQFFYILLKVASPLTLKPLVNHPSMNNFLAKLLTLIYENKDRTREEIANICLCLSETLSWQTPVLVTREILMESILFSGFEDPQKVVAKLASFVRPSRRARRAKKGAVAPEGETTPAEPSPIMPLCAGLLLATLIKKDPIFRDALFEEDSIYGKVSDEYQKLLQKAVEHGAPY